MVTIHFTISRTRAAKGRGNRNVLAMLAQMMWSLPSLPSDQRNADR